jgi:tRNA modification GTPase
MLHTDETIAAIASPPGPAARGIVRVGGPQALNTLLECFRPHDGTPLEQLAHAAVIRGHIATAPSAFGDVPADLLFWPTSRSYMRQPMAELHTLSAAPLLAAVLATLCRHGARLAEPGEFTMRAFLAGRLDLAQAEAVLGVIDARNRAELHQALDQLAGGMTQPLHALRDQLLDLLAHLEAGLDFVEEDIRFIRPDEIQQQLDDALALVARINQQLSSRSRRDAMPLVVLTGWPNVGKSSLFNCLVSNAAALVANVPGTTRDYLIGTLDLEGMTCQLCDTAGVEPRLRESAGSASIGIRSSAQQLGASQTQLADLRLLCLDAARPLNTWEANELANLDGSELVVVTKTDGRRMLPQVPDSLETSAKTGSGLAQLRSAIREALTQRLLGETAARATADRCADSIRAATESLERAWQLNRQQAGEELIGSELRVVLVELGKVVGAVYTDDILDRVFSRFCIGK